MNGQQAPQVPKTNSLKVPSLREGMATGPVLLILMFLIVVPALFVLYGSLQSDRPGAPEAEWTLEHLELVLTTGPFLRTLAGTLALSIGVGAFATGLGAMFAWITSRTDISPKGLIELFILAPLFLSPFVGAVAWVTLAAPSSGILNVSAGQLFGLESPLVNVMNIWGMVFVLTLYYIPYAYLFVGAALKNMDPALEEASYMAGRGIFATARRVTLPIVKPSMAASFFFISVLTAGIFSVPAVLAAAGGGFVPLAVRLQRAVGLFPVDYALAAAIGVLLFGVTVIGVWMYRRAMRHSRRYVTVTGRGFRPRTVSLGGVKPAIAALCWAYGLLAVVLPYSALIIVSLTPYAMTDLTRLELSLDAFLNVATSGSVLNATYNTVIVAIASPTLAVGLGLIIAFMVERFKSRVVGVLDYLGTIPIALPGIVLATGMVWAYIRTPLYGTLAILVVAYVASYLPHSLRLASNGLIQIDRSLEEASQVSGAGRVRTVGRITLPLTKPALLTGWILVFIFTIREISAAIILYSAESRVLPVLTWDFIQFGDMQSAAVVGLLQTAFLIAAVIIARLVFKVRLTSGGL